MRITLWKDQASVVEYYRASGWQIITSKVAPVVFARRVVNGRIDLKGWQGAARRESFYYSFKDPARAEAYAKEFIETAKASIARKDQRVAEKKAKRASLKASDHWAIGDVAYTSWGYDQTNVEFFQVVALKPRSVVVRQCLANSSDNGGPTGGKIAPRRFELFGPEILCPLDENGYFSAGPCWNDPKPSFRHVCHKWDGRAVFTSSYA